ncbi:hypothetical protein [Streptomyces eurythermus]
MAKVAVSRVPDASVTASQKYSSASFALPIDAWLYEAKPKPGCPGCAAEKARLAQAMKAGNASARFEAARNIRQCGHGDGGHRRMLEKSLRLCGRHGFGMRMSKHTSRRRFPARIALTVAVCALLGWVLAVAAAGGR